MTHTFIVRVERRDDLPDSRIDEAYVRGVLSLGHWLEIVDVVEVVEQPTISTNNEGDNNE